jgi:pimeloyl-ACP methyl ester carboxylesterase
MSDVDTAGPPSAPAIVLVHGSVVSRKMWLPQLRGLSARYRVVAPDLPGHGARAAEPFTMDAAVDRLAEVIQRESHERAVVAGMSLGGFVAMELAARHPALTAGLILSGSTMNVTGLLGWYLRGVAALMRRGWLRQSRAAAEAKTRRLFGPSLADVAAAQLAAGVFPEALGPAFSAMAGRDFAHTLSRFDGPILIVNGERDKPARRGEARFMAKSPRAKSVVLRGAGHACSLDQPDAYNAAVLSFVDDVF